MRIRSIKPEFWRSNDIAALSLEARLIFIGLWSYVDDNGVGIDDEKIIAAELFALEDDVNAWRATVSRATRELASRALVTRYTVAGRRYMHITSWDRHQKIDRPSRPRYPLPSADDTVEPPVNVETEPILATHSRALATVSMLEQGNRGTGEQGNSSSSSALTRNDVDDLCNHLADRIERNGAKRPTVTAKWRTACRLMLDNDGRTTAGVRAAIDWCQNDPFWRSNILSMPKLREKYDQLSLNAARERTPQRKSTTEDRVTAGLTIADQLAAQGR
jgi:hypothetical protein